MNQRHTCDNGRQGSVRADRATDVLVKGTYETLRLQPETSSQAGPLLLYFEPGPGRVWFTTFHNAVQTTEDMVGILSYLIFHM